MTEHDPGRGCGCIMLVASALGTIVYVAVWWIYGIEWVIFMFLVFMLVAGLVGLILEFTGPKL